MVNQGSTNCYSQCVLKELFAAELSVLEFFMPVESTQLQKVCCTRLYGEVSTKR